MEHERVVEMQAVASRAAAQRNAGQRTAGGTCHHLLAAAHAVDQGDGKQVFVPRPRSRVVDRKPGLPNGRLHAGHIAKADAAYQADGSGKIRLGEAETGDRPFRVAARPDLAGGCATDERDRSKSRLHGSGKLGQIVTGRYEQHDDAAGRLPQRREQLLGGCRGVLRKTDGPTGAGHWRFLSSPVRHRLGACQLRG